MREIVVIEDEPALRGLIGATLRRAGLIVHEAESAEHGLALCRAHRPDLVITDLLMPGKDGIQAICDLRREGTAPKVLAMSGGGRAHFGGLLDAALALGADAALAKPFRLEALLETIDRLCATELVRTFRDESSVRSRG